MNNYPFFEIREYYKFLTPEIMQRSEERVCSWVYPNQVFNWHRILSPIEWQMWAVIRNFGQAPLYPQYPVGKFFVDFGNPFVKVALECDGKEFHQDVGKDFKRDEVIKKEGWVIYRISGKDCNRFISELDDIKEKPEKIVKPILEEAYHYTIEGFIRAIAIFHFTFIPVKRFGFNELDWAYDCLARRCQNDPEYLKIKKFEIRDSILDDENKI